MNRAEQIHNFSVDVVIPVYNAPVLTKRCIDSVIRYLGQSVRTVLIQNDASGAETREMLDNLDYPQVDLCHATRNQGYGQSVNEAISRSSADLVLVLNSDTEIRENFLPSLCHALQQDEKLAVISPVHDSLFRYDPARYQRQPSGYIVTYRFQGYGFLIRRKLFLEIGGFDREFGRGYYEDTDLGRRLIAQGWRLGIHPDTHIRHHEGASFGRGKDYRLLVANNRARYFARYPGTQRNLLLVSSQHAPADLPQDLAAQLETIMQQGGVVYWLTPLPARQLSCLQLHNRTASIANLFRLMLRGRSRVDKRISATWILPGTPVALRILLVIFTRLHKLETKYWTS